MKQTLTRIKNLMKIDVSGFLSLLLNYGGTAAIVTGFGTLPIHFSFRLILIGVFSILLWRLTLED